MPPRHKHIPELQSLRGIAAVVVLFHHGTFAFNTGSRFHYWAEVLFNAHAAVMLFFVLSGYVLSRSLSAGETSLSSLKKFYLGRIFRIYPAMWFACILALLYLLFFRHHIPAAGASPLFLANSPTATLPGVIKSFCFASSNLVPPMWSVRVELVASILLPFIVLAIRRHLGLSLLAVTAAASFIPLSGKFGVTFIACFVIGALAFKYQSRFASQAASLPALIVSILVLLFFRRINPGWRFEVSYNAAIPILVESLASAILIIGLVQRESGLLRSGAAIRLGDISYSLYLLHFTILSALMYPIAHISGNGDLRAIALILITLPISLTVAAFSYDTIELRGIALGKKIYSAIS